MERTGHASASRRHDSCDSVGRGARGTIFALSTVPGRSGIAVVRISGPEAGQVLRSLTGLDLPAPRQATLRQLSDPGSGVPIDRCLVLWFPAPKSFTGEDMAELHLHGGRAVRAAALEAVSRITACRPAEPGEFTRRAFDNGKLDLAEIEGLADLIDAETEAQRRQALRQASGGLSRRAADWRQRLVASLAHLEAMIDFADEDLPGDLLPAVREEALAVAAEIAAVLKGSRGSERLREGFQVAILGPPNAGKSSLLNSLAERDVAIVSSVAGTTRDVVELHLDLMGLPVTLADTAGLREPQTTPDDAQDAIEAEGMRRSRERAEQADLRLLVVDGTDCERAGPLLDEFAEQRCQLVVNKSDLLDEAAKARVLSRLERLREHAAQAPREPLFVSAMSGQGIEGLVDAVGGAAESELAKSGEALVTRLRQRTVLEDCLVSLERFAEAPEFGAPEFGAPEFGAPELGAEDLRLALRALGRLVGAVDVEEVLDVIFRDFCIGK